LFQNKLCQNYLRNHQPPIHSSSRNRTTDRRTSRERPFSAVTQENLKRDFSNSSHVAMRR